MLDSTADDLPPMSTEMLKLRSELWDAEGLHLIYNVPRPATGVARTGPLTPFRGLCVAFLMYLPKDNTRFFQFVGTGDKQYWIGWQPPPHWGLYSVTKTPYNWQGKTVGSVRTFPNGYVYLYFYFEKDDTLHGWINDKYDLQDSNVHPYPVGDAGSKITLGGANSKDASTLEIHWVIWASSHNRYGKPSSSMVDQLFPKSPDGAVSFQEYDIFEMQAGTVITVRTKYTKCKKPNKKGVGVLIGCATCNKKDALGYDFKSYNNPEEVYMFRVTITEKGAIIHCKDGVKYQEMNYCDGPNAKCRAYLALECVSPLHIQVETMSQTWT